MARPDLYLRRMVTNEHLSWRRRWHVRTIHATTDDVLAARIAPEADHAQHVVEDDAMWRHLTGLPPRQRAVLVLRYYEGLDDTEIGDVLGTSSATVRSHASRALATLRHDRPLDPSGDVMNEHARPPARRPGRRADGPDRPRPALAREPSSPTRRSWRPASRRELAQSRSDAGDDPAAPRRQGGRRRRRHVRAGRGRRGCRRGGQPVLARRAGPSRTCAHAVGIEWSAMPAGYTREQYEAFWATYTVEDMEALSALWSTRPRRDEGARRADDPRRADPTGDRRPYLPTRQAADDQRPARRVLGRRLHRRRPRRAQRACGAATRSRRRRAPGR